MKPILIASIGVCDGGGGGRPGGGRIVAFLSKSDKNYGCYGNLQLPLIYNGEKLKMSFIAISPQVHWQKIYRNIPWVVLYQKYNFCPNLWTWLVATATESLNLRKNIQKSSLSEVIRGQSWNFAEMFITLASTKMAFLLPLFTRFRCYGNLNFPLT